MDHQATLGEQPEQFTLPDDLVPARQRTIREDLVALSDELRGRDRLVVLPRWGGPPLRGGGHGAAPWAVQNHRGRGPLRGTRRRRERMRGQMDDRGKCLLGSQSVSAAEEIRDALRRFSRRGIWRWGSRRAVVAVTVVTGADGPEVLLTRCADAARNHRGQLVLPGRRTDRGKSASGTARRQLAEELGMQLSPESVLGLLDDYQTRAGFVITPVVVWAGKRSEAPHVPLVAVSFADLDVEPVFVAAPESAHPVIRLPLHGEWLHAPTAAVLYQFREVALRRRRTRVAHLAEPLPRLPHSAGLFGSR